MGYILIILIIILQTPPFPLQYKILSLKQKGFLNFVNSPTPLRPATLYVKCFLNCCLTFVHNFLYSNFIYKPVTYLSSHIHLYIHAKFTREKTQDKTI